jgi:adenosylmethionine-8-amino-7-oxononanoate aminotransferase
MQRFTLHDENGKPWRGEEVARLHAACENAGLITSMGDSCLWLMPPLIITEAECDEIAERLSDGLDVAIQQASRA